MSEASDFGEPSLVSAEVPQLQISATQGEPPLVACVSIDPEPMPVYVALAPMLSVEEADRLLHTPIPESPRCRKPRIHIRPLDLSSVGSTTRSQRVGSFNSNSYLCFTDRLPPRSPTSFLISEDARVDVAPVDLTGKALDDDDGRFSLPPSPCFSGFGQLDTDLYDDSAFSGRLYAVEHSTAAGMAELRLDDQEGGSSGDSDDDEPIVSADGTLVTRGFQISSAGILSTPSTQPLHTVGALSPAFSLGPANRARRQLAGGRSSRDFWTRVRQGQHPGPSSRARPHLEELGSERHYGSQWDGDRLAQPPRDPFQTSQAQHLTPSARQRQQQQQHQPHHPVQQQQQQQQQEQHQQQQWHLHRHHHRHPQQVDPAVAQQEEELPPPRWQRRSLSLDSGLRAFREGLLFPWATVYGFSPEAATTVVAVAATSASSDSPEDAMATGVSVASPFLLSPRLGPPLHDQLEDSASEDGLLSPGSPLGLGGIRLQQPLDPLLDRSFAPWTILDHGHPVTLVGGNLSTTSQSASKWVAANTYAEDTWSESPRSNGLDDEDLLGAFTEEDEEKLAELGMSVAGAGPVFAAETSGLDDGPLRLGPDLAHDSPRDEGLLLASVPPDRNWPPSSSESTGSSTSWLPRAPMDEEGVYDPDRESSDDIRVPSIHRPVVSSTRARLHHRQRHQRNQLLRQPEPCELEFLLHERRLRKKERSRRSQERAASTLFPALTSASVAGAAIAAPVVTAGRPRSQHFPPLTSRSDKMADPRCFAAASAEAGPPRRRHSFATGIHNSNHGPPARSLSVGAMSIASNLQTWPKLTGQPGGPVLSHAIALPAPPAGDDSAHEAVMTIARARPSQGGSGGVTLVAAATGQPTVLQLLRGESLRGSSDSLSPTLHHGDLLDPPEPFVEPLSAPGSSIKPSDPLLSSLQRLQIAENFYQSSSRIPDRSGRRDSSIVGATASPLVLQGDSSVPRAARAAPAFENLSEIAVASRSTDRDQQQQQQPLRDLPAYGTSDMADMAEPPPGSPAGLLSSFEGDFDLPAVALPSSAIPVHAINPQVLRARQRSSSFLVSTSEPVSPRASFESKAFSQHPPSVAPTGGRFCRDSQPATDPQDEAFGGEQQQLRSASILSPGEPGVVAPGATVGNRHYHNSSGLGSSPEFSGVSRLLLSMPSSPLSIAPGHIKDELDQAPGSQAGHLLQPPSTLLYRTPTLFDFASSSSSSGNSCSSSSAVIGPHHDALGTEMGAIGGAGSSGARVLSHPQHLRCLTLANQLWRSRSAAPSPQASPRFTRSHCRPSALDMSSQPSVALGELDRDRESAPPHQRSVTSSTATSTRPPLMSAAAVAASAALLAMHASSLSPGPKHHQQHQQQQQLPQSQSGTRPHSAPSSPSAAAAVMNPAVASLSHLPLGAHPTLSASTSLGMMAIEAGDVDVAGGIASGALPPLGTVTAATTTPLSRGPSGSLSRTSTSTAAALEAAAAAASLTSAATPLAFPGPTLGRSIRARDFVKVGELGKGASGSVVMALYVPTLTGVALKRVNVFQRSQRRQMVAELQAFSSMHCANIVQFHGAYFSRDKGNITMMLELMNCGTLERQVQQLGPLPESLIRSLANQLVSALVSLRESCQLHRDIKPANILLNDTGTCKLSDFGLSKQLDRRVAASCQAFVGTMSYLSPERLEHSAFSYPADVWSFGLTLVFCALGKLPVPSDNYWALRDMVNTRPPCIPPPGVMPADINCGGAPAGSFSLEFRHFVSRCVAIKPEDRATPVELQRHPWLSGGCLSELERRSQLRLEEQYLEGMGQTPKAAEAVAAEVEEKQSSTSISAFPQQPQPQPQQQQQQRPEDGHGHTGSPEIPFVRVPCNFQAEDVYERLVDAVLDYHYTCQGRVYTDSAFDRALFGRVAHLLGLNRERLVQMALLKAAARLPLDQLAIIGRPTSMPML